MYFARTGYVVRGAIVVLIGILIAQMWPGHGQFLCVVGEMMGERGIGGCLTAETDSRPYFDTLAHAETGSLCEFDCAPLTESDDVRQRMINYHRAVAMDDVPNVHDTLPTSLYLWAGYYRRLQNEPEVAYRHRDLALAVDDVWLYPWHEGEAWLEVGRGAVEANALDTAATAYITAISSLDSSDPITIRFRAQAWFSRAEIALEQNDLALAQTAIMEAIALEPENSDYLTLLEQIEP